MGITLLSVHFPKAAGRSLLRSLEIAYGPNAVVTDYGDDPVDPCSQYNLDAEGCYHKARQTVYAEPVQVIHGHYHVSKYAHLVGARRITFLRHPVPNLLSIYFFWKTLPQGHALVDYCRARDLGILDFARLPRLRYLLSRTYFGGVDLTTFDFVGTMENYSADLGRLSRVLGVSLGEAHENVTAHPDYPSASRTILNDAALAAQLREILDEDIHCYKRAVAHRSATASQA
jgi:hypothetical protein